MSLSGKKPKPMSKYKYFSGQNCINLKTTRLYMRMLTLQVDKNVDVLRHQDCVCDVLYHIKVFHRRATLTNVCPESIL